MITIEAAWTNPGLPWLADLVKRHQHLIKRRLGHGDLNRWAQALSAIPEIDTSYRTLGRSVGLTVIPHALERPLEKRFLGSRHGVKVHSSLVLSTWMQNGKAT